MSTFLIHLSLVMSKFCDFVFLIFILMYNGFIHKHNGKGYLKKSNFLIFCVFVYMGSTNNLLNKSKALVYGPHTKMNDFFIGNIPYQKSPYFGSGCHRSSAPAAGTKEFVEISLYFGFIHFHQYQNLYNFEPFSVVFLIYLESCSDDDLTE